MSREPHIAYPPGPTGPSVTGTGQSPQDIPARINYSNYRVFASACRVPRVLSESKLI